MIYVFSGTGNTIMAAKCLAKTLGDDIHRFSADELQHPETVRIQAADGRVIWMFPTYSWGVPPVVRRIVEKATPGDNAVHYAVTTCGDDVGNLARQWRKDIAKRGWTAGAVFSVEMPNTYVMMKGFDVDNDELTRRKLDNMEYRIAFIAREIAAGPTIDDVVRGRFAGFKTSVIYPWFTRYRMNPNGFRATEACVGCGRCASACPMYNIVIEDSRPHWGDDCAFCSACYHACPHHAVEWRKTTTNKGQKTIFD